ncbi:MAG: NAD-dependent epimerase/dehydratase family protein [Pirellulaceae bacterium]|nr:NAD-dependent epimerase/dehydratase family protein [Pirellulaceae bacterium]
MNVLILGASGYLGGHVTEALLASGHHVTAGIRSTADLNFRSDNIRLLRGDICDADFVHTALAGQDAVIFSAGQTWSPGVAASQYTIGNVDITKSFFAATRSRRRLRIVFTSSLSTIGGTRDAIVCTESPNHVDVCQPRLNPYDVAKIECERIAAQAADDGQDVVILNPGLMIGPGASCGSKLPPPFIALWVMQGKCPFLVDSLTTFCDVRDVAISHVAALRRGASGNRYILGGHNINRSEFYRCLAELSGTRCPRTIPNALLTGLAFLTDSLQWLSRGQLISPLDRRFAKSQSLHYCGDSSKAMTALAYTSRPLQQSMLDMLRQEVELRRLPPRFDYLRQMNMDNHREMLLLRQLACASANSNWLLPRLSQLLEACQTNTVLREALAALSDSSHFNVRRARFQWPRRVCSVEHKRLQLFLEYVFFSSDQFLGEVL